MAERVLLAVNTLWTFVAGGAFFFFPKQSLIDKYAKGIVVASPHFIDGMRFAGVQCFGIGIMCLIATLSNNKLLRSSTFFFMSATFGMNALYEIYSSYAGRWAWGPLLIGMDGGLALLNLAAFVRSPAMLREVCACARSAAAEAKSPRAASATRSPASRSSSDVAASGSEGGAQRKSQ